MLRTEITTFRGEATLIPKWYFELPMSMWMRYYCKTIHQVTDVSAETGTLVLFVVELEGRPASADGLAGNRRRCYERDGRSEPCCLLPFRCDSAKQDLWLLYRCVMISASFSADISVRSPRKRAFLNYLKNYFLDRSIQTIYF